MIGCGQSPSLPFRGTSEAHGVVTFFQGYYRRGRGRGHGMAHHRDGHRARVRPGILDMCHFSSHRTDRSISRTEKRGMEKGNRRKERRKKRRCSVPPPLPTSTGHYGDITRRAQYTRDMTRSIGSFGMSISCIYFVRYESVRIVFQS